MQLLIHPRVGERGWRGVLILIAICSLTFSLATRFWIPSASQVPTIKSVDRHPVAPQRQHLDRDATQWLAPCANFTVAEPIVIETRLVPVEPLLPKHVFTDSLYNRPPPSSAFSL